METIYREARWLRRGLEKQGSLFGNQRGRWILELFLDEYPWWGLGTPHQLVILHKMFLHAVE